MFLGKDKAIPQGYMTVGALAKRMNTTVRTLQYYDREGLLPPSAESGGGRRLYTCQDVVRLHQIQSMTYLGFSLGDIKNRLADLSTPADVAAALTEQARAIREKIASLSEALQAVETLKAETLRMDAVDWRKYADIVALLKMMNDGYWAIKNFDDAILDHIRARFDEQSGAAMFARWKRLLTRAAKFQKNCVPPGSPQGQAIAGEFLDFITEFTGGDMSLLSKFKEFAQKVDFWDKKWKEKWQIAEVFLSAAINIYCTNLCTNTGYNPFAGAEP